MLSSRARHAPGATAGSLVTAGRAKVLGIVGIITSIVVPILVVGLVAGVLSAANTDYTTFTAGQCFNRTPGSSGQVSVVRVSCSAPHNAQATGKIEAPDGAWPGPAGFDTLASPTCFQDARPYLNGQPAPNVEVAFVYPTQQDWTSGQRTILCDIRTRDGSRITGAWPTSGGAASGVST